MKKYDFVIIGIVILASIGIFVWNTYTGLNTTGDKYVEITVKGEVIKELIFDEAYTEQFIYSEGDHTNTIVSDHGEVYILEANCHDQICVKTRSIDQFGQVIVCLPHQLVVEIKSNDSSETLDIDSIAE